VIRHIILWRLNDPSDRGKKEAQAVLEAMRGVIPGMLTLEVGLNYNSKEIAFDICLMTTHESAADQELYQNHPEHLKVKAYMSRAAFARAMVDYEF